VLSHFYGTREINRITGTREPIGSQLMDLTLVFASKLLAGSIVIVEPYVIMP
jgi:hypothetical protein